MIHAVVGDAGGDERHLQRGRPTVALADRGPGERARCPGRPGTRSGTPTRPAAGRSSGGRCVEPEPLGAVRPCRVRRSSRRPSGRRRVLHDTRRISNSVPPHALPPKFDEVVVGEVDVVARSATGYTGWSGVTTPLSTPIEPVTTLNVDPGRTARGTSSGSSGLPGAASRNVLDLAGRPGRGSTAGSGRRTGSSRRRGSRPSRGSRATTEPRLVAERVAGDLLHVLADREGDVADVLVVDEEVGHVAQVDLGRLAGELVVVGRSTPVAPKLKLK